MANNILQNQSSDIAIEYASAFRWAYHKSKQWKALIWIFTFLLACIQIIATSKPAALTPYLPNNIEPYIVFVLLLTLLLSTLGKALIMDAWQIIGNTAQQAHDYTVLNLGVKPSFLSLNPSNLKRCADNHKQKSPSDIDNLKTWWPSYIEGLPDTVALAICQLSVLKWESELRKKYQYTLWLFSAAVVIILIALAQALQYVPHQIIFYLITPAAPFFGLLIDEIISNHRCSKIASTASKNSENLWITILQKSKTDEDLKISLESIQYDWQQYRKNSTQIFDWLYWLTRQTMEQDMGVDAQSLANDYRSN